MITSAPLSNMSSPALFTNSALLITLDDTRASRGYFSYDAPSPLLFHFSSLFQCVVSQAGTYLLTGTFHDRECGIMKSEGGCRIGSKGELVLYQDYCRWDMGRGTKDELVRLATMISRIVLEWDPMDPIDSMLRTAAAASGCTVEKLRGVLERPDVGLGFGDPLTRFFNWNPFSLAPINEDYERWVHVHVQKQPEADIRQRQADRVLGKELLQKMNDFLRTKANERGDNYWTHPLCCRPQRSPGEEPSLRFWINTGRNTQIDGWKTQAQIEAFLTSDGVLTEK